MAELLVGCGNRRDKILYPLGLTTWTKLHTLDIDPNCKPGVIADLEQGLPYASNSFSEVHAYDVLEHLGTQGDFKAFFRHFGELARVVKNYGFICGITPRWDGTWAWNDPGHTRIISPHTLTYLNQAEYKSQIGRTAMTD